ncbi:MAG: hypothetical protein JST75_12280 [Bacteroidetes bacterium]|nr:hypothetical protein [Bacteroidota bacterium]
MGPAFKKLYQCTALLLTIMRVASAQDLLHDDPKSGRISPKELAIPASPVFDLMGVVPSQVTRTSDIKDFKVDWSFKSWKLNPNLAIQAQPVWELFYNRKEVTKYQQASSFMRRLSSLDISVGTVQNEDNDRRIGFAAKINLFNNRDPLLQKELYQDVLVKFRKEKSDLESQLKELENKLDTTQNILLKPDLRSQIRSTEEQLASIGTRRMDEINRRAKIFVEENWNASSLDFAMGRIYTYGTDSAGSLTSLRLNRNTGWGMWLNGSFGIGKKILVSGLFRTTWYEEQLNFLVQDKITGEQSTQQAVAENNLYSAGINIRYGGAIYNFFVELLYEKKGLKTPVQALEKTFTVPDSQQIVASSVKWNVVEPNTLNFGGDWRVNRNLILNYGMRCVFDSHWKFRTFTPVVSISCMMR